MHDEEIEDGEQPDVDDYPTLQSVARFNRLLNSVDWYSNVGEPVGAELAKAARAYMDYSGFPHADLAIIETWSEAGEAAANTDWNSEWWEAEEQTRMGLIDAALTLISDEDLTMALTHVTATASPLLQHAAENWAEEQGIEDEELIRAAVGAGVQASYQAALVLAAGEEDDHPFALKFKLFELGRWPIAITGSSFNLF